MEKELQNVLEMILARLDKMDSRLDKMDSRLDRLESRQDEIYLLVRSLEENVKVTRAEQEKMSYILADVQGKVNSLAEKVEDHESVISQLRAIS